MTLWEHAQQIIPGGNQLYSKRPTKYCDNFPSHYIWAKGNEITSAEGITYKDFTTMGIGCCTLGYGDPDVDAAVIQSIAAGQFSSLNCIEELELAEVLLKLNPKMDMVKFARTGGEACKIAVEICRTYTGRKTILQHGYSGWILGTPEKSYSLQINEPEDLPEAYDHTNGLYACVIMEPVRNYPNESYKMLKAVRKWCTNNHVPLIFDEITSGNRVNIGGYYATKSIIPDLAVFGKNLGNGYPISAVVGKEEIMEAAEETFISSTMWSERIGYTAALATLEEMRKRNIPTHLLKTGKLMQVGWESAAALADIEIEVYGIPPLAGFTFVNNHRKNITYYSQEMLKRGYLAGNQFYASYAQKEKDVVEFMYHVEEVFAQIGEGNIKVEGKLADEPWKRVN